MPRLGTSVRCRVSAAFAAKSWCCEDQKLRPVGLIDRYLARSIAVPLFGTLVLGSRVPLSVNSGSPRKGDDRFYITLAYRL